MNQNQLNISIIAIGDELLNGRTRDTNAHWLSHFLFERSMNLYAINIVGDDEEQLARTLQLQLAQSDVVITSGGVGPTIDDKTKNILANFFNQKLVENEAAAKITKANYLRRQKSWEKGQNHYDLFPEKFFPINNPQGFAPGLGYFFEEQKKPKLVLSAPGVPREFRAMMEEEFLPVIKKHFAHKLSENYQTVIRTHSIPEETIFFELCPTLWQELEAFGKVSSLPHIVGIDIVITHHVHSKEEYLKAEKKLIDHLKKSKLHEFIWQFGNLSMTELILEKAREKNITFSFAESCTGGLCSSKFTDLTTGSSAVFWGSVVSYDNSVKESMLGVKNETLKNFGAVSTQTAEEMCEGVKNRLQTTIGISTTGIAGPSGGSDKKPVGTVAIGVSSPLGTRSHLYHFVGDRQRLKDRFSETALLELLFEIEKI